MNRKLISPTLMLVLATLSCSIPGGGTPTVTSVPAPATPTPTALVTSTPTPVVSATPTSTPTGVAVPPLTPDMLRNGTYFAPFYARTVTLTNGSYTEGSGVTYYSVQMLSIYALGDLNGDGVADAAILLVENGGGSGQFESLVVVVNAGGSMHQVGQAELGDRYIINTIAITSGKVVLDMVVDGPGDPLCCPSLPEVQTYRLVQGQLWLSRQTSQVSGGAQRAINISTPADLASVSYPFTVSGSITLTPPGNTLTYRIYLPDGTKVNESPVTVSAASPGGPGTFSFPINLTMAGISGTIIIQVLDLIDTDTPTPDMDSVVLTTNSGGATPPVPAAFFTPHLNAYCRSGPDPIFESIALAMKGQTYPIDGRNQENTYYLLFLTSQQECWVLQSAGEASGDLSSIRVMLPVPTPTPTPQSVNCSQFVDKNSCDAVLACTWTQLNDKAGVCTNK